MQFGLSLAIMADISAHADDLTEEPVVVLHFDKQQTEVPAYNDLAEHIANQFRPYDFEMGPARKVYAQDVISDIPESTVEWAYFVVKEVSSFAIYEYLRRNYGEGEDNDVGSNREENITIKTESGDVVIKEMTMMSAREAKEVTGHFEHLSEGALARHYGDDDEIIGKYGHKAQEVDDDEEDANKGESKLKEK